MKKGWIISIVIVVILGMGVLWSFGSYNNLVTSEELVDEQWANVENQYQRRSDLIPNLVSTVKGYASHESSTLENVIAARSKATQMNIDVNKLDEASLKKYQQAQGELSQALGKLLAITENYPDLKANQNFLELQAQLEGTENRITVARDRFNSTARQYNTLIRKFPAAIVAKLTGFDKTPYFQAEAEASKAPKVEF